MKKFYCENFSSYSTWKDNEVIQKFVLSKLQPNQLYSHLSYRNQNRF